MFKKLFVLIFVLASFAAWAAQDEKFNDEVNKIEEYSGSEEVIRGNQCYYYDGENMYPGYLLVVEDTLKCMIH